MTDRLSRDGKGECTMTDSVRIACPCLFGLESVLAGEARRMGMQDVTVSDGRVVFSRNFFRDPLSPGGGGQRGVGPPPPPPCPGGVGGRQREGWVAPAGWAIAAPVTRSEARSDNTNFFMIFNGFKSDVLVRCP